MYGERGDGVEDGEGASGPGKGATKVSNISALRHLLIFQVKLAADASRDFLLSPLSIVAFAIDVIRKPDVKDSLYLRLMLMGRRSDRFINLFDDHRDAGQFTIDSAVDELEELLRSSTMGDASAGESPGQAPEPKSGSNPEPQDRV
jgi:hypothetical protein